MLETNLLLRIVAISVFLTRIVYWYKTEMIADKEKPKNQGKTPLRNVLSEYINWVIQIFVIVQLLFYLPILSIPSHKLEIQIIGLGIMIIGLGICISARKELATNWTNGYEYQIKKGHELITSGIYSILRHPIYTGYALLFIGGEMVVGSWLFVSFTFFFITSYIQGKREEKILLAHFGDKYKDYMKYTKMLIPLIV